MPTGEYRDRLPKFTGSNTIFVEDHLNAFLKFVDDLEIEHEDVVMKMFMQTLEGDVEHDTNLSKQGSIDGWDSFQKKFIERWADKQDNSILLETLSSLKKGENETVLSLTLNFRKLITGSLLMLGLMQIFLYYII
jgi:hypothetical protein